MVKATVQHAERQHALLSASGSKRWLSCPPSARLEEKFEESNPAKTSVYAEEGTLAHEMADISLQKALNLITDKVYKRELAKVTKTATDKGFDIDEMTTEVSKYTTYVLEQLAEARKRTPDAVILVEQRLNFSHLVEKGFGTGDTVLIADGTLEVIDLKYGKGVKVMAEENPQGMLYGAGALREFEFSYDIDNLKITIVQPRLDHIDSWDVTPEELTKWGEEVVKPIAAKAYLGEGISKAGEHCKWCKVKAMCSTLAKKNIALARNDFKEPQLMDIKQLTAIYEQIPMLVDWAESIGEHLKQRAIEGDKVPGYKIVEGTSRRSWNTESKVIDYLQKQGLTEDQYTQTKLVGIPAIEKILGKDKVASEMGRLIVRPGGSPTLVHETDKRPAMGIQQAKQDFEESLD